VWVIEKNRPTVHRVTAAMYLIFLLYITLVPRYEIKGASENFITRLLMKPFIHEPTNFVLNINPVFALLGNIVLFLPLFLLLHYSSPRLRPRWGVLICGMASGGIELLQLWVPGRVSSLSDFLLNVSGPFALYLFMKLSKRANQ
jgi:glycopeptide antibiotics resistance protein